MRRYGCETANKAYISIICDKTTLGRAELHGRELSRVTLKGAIGEFCLSVWERYSFKPALLPRLPDTLHVCTLTDNLPGQGTG